MSEYAMETNEKIKRARVHHGITQEEVAREIGVTLVYYNKLERGAQKFPKERLEAVCRFLNVDLDDPATYEFEIEKSAYLRKKDFKKHMDDAVVGFFCSLPEPLKLSIIKKYMGM